MAVELSEGPLIMMLPACPKQGYSCSRKVGSVLNSHLPKPFSLLLITDIS